jgi:SRSO17 transposase
LIERYKHQFQCARKNSSDKARQYLHGLFQAECSNISAMSETVMGSSYEQLQHFITSSPWSASAVKKQVAHDAVKAFTPLRGQSALLVDEYSCRKQGQSSVGVARQYLGCLGKTDNGQVAVVATLAKQHYTAMVASRLFLPESWIHDPKSLDKCGVPSSVRVGTTKPEIAAAMVAELYTDGVVWDFLNADSLYGHSTAFRRTVDCLCHYVVFVHADQTIYLGDPKPQVKERLHERGRRPTRLETTGFHQTVAEFVREQPKSAWKLLTYQQGTKGAYTREVLTADVWTWDGEEEHAVKERLVVSRKRDASDLKYSLSNDRQHRFSEHRLLVQQMYRYWVERSIQDAKHNLGLTEYQVRSWQAWEHHTALTMLALLFLTEERIANHRGAPLLSCSDIRDILAKVLPSKQTDSDALERMIAERHRRRASDIEHYKRFPASS